MAISATLELREQGSAVVAALLKSYTVIDLDYTLKRALDKTGRPASVALLVDYVKVTVRATKEAKASFHEWIHDPDMTMDCILKIYDSTGYGTAIAQNFTGGDTADYAGVATDLIADELEDSLDYAMDNVSDYGTYNSDIYDEMSREEMVSYIASKNLPIEVDKNDTDVILKKKIRDYNKYVKDLDTKTSAELEQMAAGLTPQPVITDATSDEEKKRLYKELLKQNYETKDYSYFEQLDEIARKDKNKAYDKLKDGTSTTVSNVASKAINEVLESARSITFENSYCVSLREHFHGDPNSKGTLDATYPWVIEVGIKPGNLKVTGWNVGGAATPLGTVEFKFFEK